MYLTGFCFIAVVLLLLALFKSGKTAPDNSATPLLSGQGATRACQDRLEEEKKRRK
jgi:hypothetical protein